MRLVLRYAVALAAVVTTTAGFEVATSGSAGNEPVCMGCEECDDRDLITPAASSEPDKEWIAAVFYCSMGGFYGRCSELPDCDAAPSMAVQLLDCAGQDVRAQLAIPEEWRVGFGCA